MSSKVSLVSHSVFSATYDQLMLCSAYGPEAAQEAAKKGIIFKPKTCDYGSTVAKDEFCTFPVTDLHPGCTEENSFGFKEGKPCLFLKMNKVFSLVLALSVYLFSLTIFDYRTDHQLGAYPTDHRADQQHDERGPEEISSGHRRHPSGKQD